MDIELSGYPERPHSAEVANRLFLPLGYAVAAKSGSLRLSTERDVREVVSELPALLLALDRKARLSLGSDELEGNYSEPYSDPESPGKKSDRCSRWTDVRRRCDSVVPGLERRSETARETAPDDESLLSEDPILTALVPRIPCAPPQRERAAAVLSRINMRSALALLAAGASASVQASKPEGEPSVLNSHWNITLARNQKVVVEQKHMGSRGIVVLCQSSTAAKERFGIDTESTRLRLHEKWKAFLLG